MKVLIWNEVIKERSGGPPSYLYNLKKSVELNQLQNNIYFFYDILKNDSLYDLTQDKNSSLIGFLKKNISKRLLGNLKISKYIKWLEDYKNQKQLVDFNQFDLIHFHSTFDLYRNLFFLKNYKGKVLLSSHSPKIYFKEIIEDFFKMNVADVWKKNYSKLEKIEEEAFLRADYIIYPCKEAMEPYYNTWNKFEEIISNKKLKYFLTATTKSKVLDSKEKVFEKFNIPQDAFVIVYAGRHNEVKGYDVLKKFGELVFQNNNLSNVYFLILGKEEPLKGLQHKRWIEVGWTNDPHSIINASDVFILPNRETYFDLILLEVLSLGKIMILSNTGGNRHFKEYKNSGLLFYDENSPENLCNCFLELYHKDSQTIKDMQLKNLEIFDEHFGIDNFATKYYELILNL